MTSVLIIGATQGIGRDLAAEYARRGASVVITGRTAERAEAVAAELTKDGAGTVSGLALDLTRPAGIAGALTTVERVDRLAVVGMVRDRNSIAEYNVATAAELAVTKVVGYPAVVAALAGRLAPDGSVLLFGGQAKAHPYPGSTTVSAVNGAVTGLVRTLSIELSPIRVNGIHPGPIGDSPYWAGNTAVLEANRKVSLTGRLGTMGDIVDASIFLLENRSTNGIDLAVDGGHR